VDEEAYRALGAEAAHFLAEPAVRDGALPAWIRAVAGQRALVAERTPSGWELFALREGHVVDDAPADDASLEAALAALAWDAPAAANDGAWVSAWLHAPKRRGVWHALPAADLARAVRDASAR
jgi:hypothetical protein